MKVTPWMHKQQIILSWIPIKIHSQISEAQHIVVGRSSPLKFALNEIIVWCFISLNFDIFQILVC